VSPRPRNSTVIAVDALDRLIDHMLQCPQTQRESLMMPKTTPPAPLMFVDPVVLLEVLPGAPVTALATTLHRIDPKLRPLLGAVALHTLKTHATPGRVEPQLAYIRQRFGEALAAVYTPDLRGNYDHDLSRLHDPDHVEDAQRLEAAIARQGPLFVRDLLHALASAGDVLDALRGRRAELDAAISRLEAALGA
jgi:hypothetical protein